MKTTPGKTQDELLILDAKERIDKVKSSLNAMQQEMDKKSIEIEPLRNVIFRNRLAVNLIFCCSVFGTTLLLAASINYLLIPDPSSYITTQNGKNIQINPIKVE